jgi:sulfite reductase alpha subunit-like flavoprotein
LDQHYTNQLRCTEVCLKPRYGAFRFPELPQRTFSREELATHQQHTAIAGAVFDMSNARVEHAYLRELLGGRDVTLFFLRRMDSSDMSETWEQIESGGLSPLQKEYLNDYLHQFNREYRYVGKTLYADVLHEPSVPSLRPRRVPSSTEIASRRVLRTAEESNRLLGHENLGFLSEAAGFMPLATPRTSLPPEFVAWDHVVLDLTELYRSLGVREVIDRLSVLDASPRSLPDGDLLRAASVLGMLAHAYWYCETSAPEKLPEAITAPWAAVRSRLGRPDAVLSYIDLIVYNWSLINPQRNDPMRADNMRLLIPTVGNNEERTFYLTQTEILAQAAPLIGAIVRAQEAVAHDDPKSLANELSTIINSLQRIVGESLLNINPNPASPSYVNPVVWAKTVAPFAVPMQRGVLGPSGTSSPVFSLLDIFFGRSRNETFLGREIRELRRGYPLFWREFLGAVAEISVPKYVTTVDDASLSGMLKDAVEIYAGENGFLGRHRMKVYGYLEQAFKVGRNVTIGGFAGVFKDRTWDQVDTELKNSQAERLETFPKGCHYAHVHSVGQTHGGAPDGVKHVVLDVEGSGIRHAPGDRCGVLPENREELIEATLRALRATGDEQMVLTPEWISAVRLRWGYETAERLTLRDLLRFGRIRPVLPRMAEALHAATQNPTLLRAILAQTTTRWELWDLLELLRSDGYEPERLWKSSPRSSEHICRVVPPETFRMYSISSVRESLERDGAKEIELTVGRVRYSVPAAEGGAPIQRLGTASNFLATSAGRREPISIVIEHPPRFSLPSDRNAPLLILAGGTGISPMRSFILERSRYTGARCHLFLACRSYEDFYYQDELLHWVNAGKLSLHVAFSREDVGIRHVPSENGGSFVREPRPRRRIEDLLLDPSLEGELQKLLKGRAEGGLGAYVYICGRSRFARTVHQAFRELLSRFQDESEGKRQAVADQVLNTMVGEGRYMLEIFTDARTWDLQRKEIDVSELIEKNNYVNGHWLLIGGIVYDVSEFIQQHPGGTHVLRGYAGTDATMGYQRAHRDRSEVDAMREMYEIGQIRRLELGSVTRVVDVDGHAQSIALSSLHRGWTNLCYLLVEMQNALVSDQSLQSSTAIAREPRNARPPYKLQRAIETHERFKRTYLDAMLGEPVVKVWQLTRAMCAPETDPTLLERRIAEVTAQREARLVEAAAGSLRRQLRRIASGAPTARPQDVTKLVGVLDDIFSLDRRFLEELKQVLRKGMKLFETHEAKTLEEAGAELLSLLGSVPDLASRYYGMVAHRCQEIALVPTDVPMRAVRAAHEPDQRALRALISTDYWLMEEDAGQKFALLRRHAVPVDSLQELLEQNHEIIEQMRTVQDDFGIVVDMRQAPPRNDPAFEDAMGQLRREIFNRYARVAVLVSSEIGVLQVDRIGRNEGSKTYATQSEAEAIRFAARA